MKKLLFALLIVLFSLEGMCLAAMIGPVQPIGQQGQFSLGAGAYFDSFDFGGKAEGNQTTGFLQGNYAFTNNCGVYILGGIADLSVEKVFGGSGKFDADSEFFGAAELKGQIMDLGPVALGVFAQGTWFDDFEDTDTVGGVPTTVTFEDNFQLLGGLALQGEVEGAILYGGAFGYTREGDVSIKQSGSTTTTSYEEDGNIGGFAGIRWLLNNGVTIELESQLRTRVSVGGAVSFTF